ncbi:MAG: type II secretion system F family protein [Sedimentisphaerales bacterium]|nr:type II secretion system F family protein [Sedimentisphaerales bacterium]
MSIFEYQALNPNGRLMTGTLEAADRDQAADLLGQMKLTVNSLEKSRPAKPKTTIGRSEFLLFNQQLASLTKTGIPLEKGLRELAADTVSKSMRKLIANLVDKLESGAPLEDAFEQSSKNFPPLYRHIIQAGIKTGRLNEMLTSLNRHLEMANQTRRIIFEALCYPLVVLVLAFAVISFLFIGIIPQFETIYLDFGIDLPSITMFMLKLSRNAVPSLISISIFIGSVIFIWKIFALTKPTRRFKESLLLEIPVLGRLYHFSMLSRFADSLALLIATGCDLAQAMNIAAGTTACETLIRETDALGQQLQAGANITDAGQFCSFIPKIFIYSIQLGSQRNELTDNLYGLADMYDQQVNFHQTRLQSFLLPFMLILVGGIVAFMVIALFMPMFSMIQQLSN